MFRNTNFENDWPPLGGLPSQQSPSGRPPLAPYQMSTLPEPPIYHNRQPNSPQGIWGSGNTLPSMLPFSPPQAPALHRQSHFNTSNSSSHTSTPVGEQSPNASLDRFAPVYVPLWMRQIATAEPARIIQHFFQPVQNGHAFAKAIFPKTLYEDIREEKARAEKQVMNTVNLTLDRLEKIDNSSVEPRYASKLLSLQVKEFQARKLDLAASTLYNVEISQATAEEGGKYGLFKLEAPEIREGYPMLDVNDLVFLRHLRWGPEGINWDGIVYLAEVRAIKRSQALVLVQCNSLNGIVKQAPERFIVGFEPQGRPYYAARDATIRIQDHLQRETAANLETRLTHNWLFPSLADHVRPMPPYNEPPSVPVDMKWKDHNLNSEQKFAVTSLVFHRRLVPYLVSGPPGTGKTKTIVEGVLQIIDAYPTASILLCGASNPSTDTLATRLSAHLSPKEMFRLNDESRPFDEVSGRLLPYCRIAGERFSLPEFATLRQYRVIVTSALDVSVLSKYMFTNEELTRLEHVVLSHWQPQASKPLHYQFDYFICDEAAQLTEQDILPALSLMLPSVSTRSASEHRTRRLPQVCLVGDFQQLGPFVTSAESRAAELDLSLLQRLFERPLYKEHPRARQNLRPSLLVPTRDVAKEVVESDIVQYDLSAPLCNLVKNYRSHVGLLMVPSASFYDDTLQPFAGQEIQNTPLLEWPFLTSNSIPMLIWHTEGTEDMVDEGSSWFNKMEMENVIHCVTDLVRGSSDFAVKIPIKPTDISIISPFREQVWKIRVALRLLGLGEVNVGRESDMQGAENRVVIISPVRTSLRFVSDDRRRNRGLIFEPKRFNVAVTRSKELLIVVGHVPTLHSDPFWRALIQLGLRHNCCKGIDADQLSTAIEDTALGVGALEELYMRARSCKDEEETMPTVAGSVARIALREETE